MKKKIQRGNRRSARNENYRTNNSALNSLTRITNSDNSSESNDDGLPLFLICFSIFFESRIIFPCFRKSCSKF